MFRGVLCTAVALCVLSTGVAWAVEPATPDSCGGEWSGGDEQTCSIVYQGGSIAVSASGGGGVGLVRLEAPDPLSPTGWSTRIFCDVSVVSGMCVMAQSSPEDLFDRGTELRCTIGGALATARYRCWSGD